MKTRVIERARRLELVAMRHGPAEARDPARWPRDDRRPLTAKGADQTRRAAQGIATLVPEVALVATSAAVRARRTAEILRAVYPAPPALEVWEELGAGRLAGPVLDRLAADAPTGATVVVVGHDPTLAELAGLALAGEGIPIVEFSKAGAALFEFPRAVRPGAARLRWALTRRQLSAVRG
ncbi:MAG TPA: histidine phosphatase family protein [Thermoplasmata archaeon]|nr:histidine phosphatase family protein [Thermoplasmata archaeon]